MPRLCLALLLFWLACPSWALTPAPLDSDDLRFSLGPYTGYYEDADGSLSSQWKPATEFVYPDVPRRDGGTDDWARFPRVPRNSDLATLRCARAPRRPA